MRHNGINSGELDRWITGNYGENSISDDYEMLSADYEDRRSYKPFVSYLDIPLQTDEDFHATPPYLTGLQSNPCVYEP